MYAENENRPTYRFSWGGKMTAVVRVLLVVTVAAYLVQLITGDRIAGADLGYLFGVNAAAFRPWQPVTALFLHSVDNPFHVAFNMIWLWLLGKDVERAVGARKFIVLYLVGGIVAGLCWLGVEKLTGGNAHAVGASGAVFAVVAAFPIFYPDRRFFVFKAAHFVIAIIAFEVIMSVVDSRGDVAHVAHVGGAAFGFLLFKGAPLWASVLGRYRGRRKKIAWRDEARIRAKVDALLNKISRSGLDSLTNHEKAFLKKASRRFKHNPAVSDPRDHDYLRRK